MAGPRTSTPKRSVAVARVDAPDPFSKRVVEQNSDDDYVPGGRKASKPKAPRKPSAPRRKLLDLPLDLQSEILKLVDPPDLVWLSRTCKRLRALLTSRTTGRPIWRASLGRQYTLGLSEPPLGIISNEPICEILFTLLVYPSVICCTGCGVKCSSSVEVEWLWNARLCDSCRDDHLCEVDEAGPQIVPQPRTENRWVLEAQHSHAHATLDAVKDNEPAKVVRKVVAELLNDARAREELAVEIARGIKRYRSNWQEYYSSTLKVNDQRVCREVFDQHETIMRDHLLQRYSAELFAYIEADCRGEIRLRENLNDRIKERRNYIFQDRESILDEVLVEVCGSTAATQPFPATGDFALFEEGRAILSEPVTDLDVQTFSRAKAKKILKPRYKAAVERSLRVIDRWRADITDNVELLQRPTSLFRCGECGEGGEALAWPDLTRHECLGAEYGQLDHVLAGNRGVKALIEAVSIEERKLVPSILKAVRPSVFTSASELVEATLFVDPAGQSEPCSSDEAALTSNTFGIGPYLHQIVGLERLVPFTRVAIDYDFEQALGPKEHAIFGCDDDDCAIPLTANEDQIWLHRLRVHGWCEDDNEEDLIQVRMRRP